MSVAQICRTFVLGGISHTFMAEAVSRFFSHSSRSCGKNAESSSFTPANKSKHQQHNELLKIYNLKLCPLVVTINGILPAEEHIIMNCFVFLPSFLRSSPTGRLQAESSGRYGGSGWAGSVGMPTTPWAPRADNLLEERSHSYWRPGWAHYGKIWIKSKVLANTAFKKK